MRLYQSSMILVSTLAVGLVGCAKSTSSNVAPPNPAAKETPETVQPDDNRPPLGADLCKDASQPCSSFSLVLPEGSVPIGLSQGSAARNVLDQALPKVLSTADTQGGLTLKVNLPDQTPGEAIEIVTRKESGTSDYTRQSQLKMIAAAVNEASSDNLYAFAQMTSTERLKITFQKLTPADKKVSDELPAWRVAPTVSMGERSVRGQSQEVEISKTKVDYSLLSGDERAELKRNHDMKKTSPEIEMSTLVTVYFQNGKLKAAPENKQVYSHVDESKDYCFLEAEIPATVADSASSVIGGVITLVSGSQNYGPVDGQGKPSSEFTQTSRLGLRSTGAASMVVPGKGFNKFGNGRRDNAHFFSLGCTSKKAEAMTVWTITSALGANRVAVTYPRADIVESYLDEKQGVDLNLGQINYRWKRIDRAVGSQITILKDIEADDPAIGNVSFQNGHPVTNIDFKGGALCYLPNHLKAGTKFKLAQASPNTVSFNDQAPISNGAVFSTDNKQVESMKVYVVADWMAAIAKVSSDASLLDAQAIKDCFGPYISIAE